MKRFSASRLEICHAMRSLMDYLPHSFLGWSCVPVTALATPQRLKQVIVLANAI